MALNKPRLNDNDDNGYRKRRAFDPKTVAVLITAILGPAGIVGISNYFTDPNIQMQADLYDLKEQVKVNEKMATANTGQIAARTARVEEYIKTHDREESLRQQLIDQELEFIKKQLDTILRNQERILNSKK